MTVTRKALPVNYADQNTANGGKGTLVTSWASVTQVTPLATSINTDLPPDANATNSMKLTDNGSGSPAGATTFSSFSSNYWKGMGLWVKGPSRTDKSYVPFYLHLATDSTNANRMSGTFTVPTDGQWHFVTLPFTMFTAAGTFTLGTDAFAYVRIVERDDVVNLGYPGLSLNESALFGPLYFNPHCRPKFMIRFDDGLSDLVVNSATFTADGINQAWNCKSLLDQFGFKASCFILTKRVGTSNSVKTFCSWSQLQTLQAAGWDICFQTHADPGDTANNGVKLLGPVGYASVAISSVDTVGDTITTTAAHHILTSTYYGGYPLVFSGTDLPAPLVTGTTYWARDTSTTAFKLFTNENDAVANTNAIDLTTAGIAANFTFNYANSTADDSGIYNDFSTGVALMNANGFGATSMFWAPNQGAYDLYVQSAAQRFGFKAVFGITGNTNPPVAYSRIPVGELSGGITNPVIGNWITLSGALQIDSATLTQAQARQYVRDVISQGGTGMSYLHSLTTTTGPIIAAMMDELRTASRQGLIDVVTVSQWYNGLTNARVSLT